MRPAVANIGLLPPLVLALPVAITMAYASILPMNTIPNVIMLNSGYFRQRHMIIYGLMLSITATFVMLLLAIPYWQIIGFFPTYRYRILILGKWIWGPL